MYQSDNLKKTKRSDLEKTELDKEIDSIENIVQKKKRLMPKKADFRMRAHINPLTDTPYP